MIYIVIKEFDENLAKRQPWYTVQQLLCVLTNSGYDVSIVNKVPDETYGQVTMSSRFLA